ncbi:DUF2934 domain-containing protein [uncultured Limimaricola sp.]|uniref:DUF2934 domain-containing protein n=1 Tax=uncultured Limimaricola sp. TaxID=2211667 RepID=UPI0030FBB455
MADDREERIRKRAYEMWERDGSPEGQDHAHWHDAAREIEAEMASETDKPEADIHAGDEGGAGLGSADVTGAEGTAPAKAPRAKAPRKTAGSTAKAATKSAAKTTKPAAKTTTRKPRAKKGDTGSSA